MTITRLSETQLVILTAAAGRDDGAVFPIPASLTLRGGARDKSLKSLIKRGLIDEQPAAPNVDAWRESEDGERLAPAITAAGLKAIGIEIVHEHDAACNAAKPNAMAGKIARIAETDPARLPTTKQALVLDLLRRDNGVSVPEIMEATGWQAHSVRGFLSGAMKKKLALPLVVEKNADGERRYHVAALTEADI